MSRKRGRAQEETSVRSAKRQRVQAASDDDAVPIVVWEVHHVDPPIDMYHTKVQLPCRAPDSGLSEQGYIGCAPDDVMATLSGASTMTKRRFRVNIYRDATRFIIGRINATVLLDMRHYTDMRTVSHEHARIAYQPDIKSFVLDNIGRNGTRVNGEVIRSGVARSFTTLAHNDVITIAGVDMCFQLTNPPH